VEGNAGIAGEVRSLAIRAREGGRALAIAGTEVKNGVLRRAAALLRERGARDVLPANERDCARAIQAGLSAAMIDRLRLDAGRLAGIAQAIEAVAALPDPIASVEQLARRPNGLLVGRMRIPLGLVAIVYESRPNVTVEAAALCIKSGNACLLRGGSEALESNRALAAIFRDAVVAGGLPADCVALVPTSDRAALAAMLELSGIIDLLIPRGGEGLIRYVTENARVPVIQHYKGVCHVYVDGDADLAIAESIVVNAKVQRPGVCNAMETLLIDAACADRALPRIAKALRAAGVELRGDRRARAIVADLGEASESDWDAEYLDLVLSIAIVDGIDGAMRHVARHGSSHTESIVTSSYEHAQRWVREVDASCVLVNASTRFNDGAELGLGAEMGISTSKLHAYGAMGLEQLCAQKWIAYGNGQIRS
jgi:glutamate-5-semialdehyde dehydrogenase